MGPVPEYGLAILPAPHAPYRTKQDIAYLSIKDWIIYGAIAPGERLTIREAAARLDISETPVRAALTKLEAEGLVEHQSHIGATVTEIKVKELEEAHVILAVLQGFAAEQAAQHATEDQVAALYGILDELERLPENASVLEFTARNFAFHRAISDASGYFLITSLQEQLFEKTGRGRAIWMVTSHREKARIEHREVADAIKRRDPPGARAAIEHHWLRAGKDFTAQVTDMRQQSEAGREEPEPSSGMNGRRGKEQRRFGTTLVGGRSR